MARKVFKYILLAIIAVNLAIFIWVFLSPGPPPRVVLPNPNGHDDFVKAGQIVLSSAVDYTNLSREELSSLIATNAEALRTLRAGLSHECREPVEYTANYATVGLGPLAAFKRLALTLRAEGRLAELEGRTNNAANIYLDGVRFGQECVRGGLVISRLVGVACETIAIRPLQSLADSLDAPKLRELARALESIDAKEEPVSETLKTEKHWSRQTFGIRGQIDLLITYKQTQKMMDLFTAKVQKIQLQRRRLILSLAARAYELEKGKPPQSVAELVPDYLKAVPKDPATGKELSLSGK